MTRRVRLRTVIAVRPLPISLPAAYARLLLMRGAGWTDEAIAEALNVPVEAVTVLELLGKHKLARASGAPEGRRQRIPTGDPELAVDPLQVIVDGAGRDDEASGDVLAAEAGRRQRCDLPLAGGEEITGRHRTGHHRRPGTGTPGEQRRRPTFGG